eukprot:g9846.t1
MALSVEPSKPRLIYDARPLNVCVKKVPFSTDMVARVADVSSSGWFMTSLDDKSAFHQVLLRPASWPLFGISYKGVDCCWCVTTFGFSLSPWCYYTLTDAKADYLRARGIPALAYLDDSWLSNFSATHGSPPREQWLAAGEATYLAMLVAFFCGQFIAVKKYEVRPVQVLQYLGIVCDSVTMSFRVPADKLAKLHQLIRGALDDGRMDFSTLQRIAGKCMSMTVAIRPASLWTHAMFAVLAAMEEGGSSMVDLTCDASADLLGELRQWLSLTTSSHEGPWQRVQYEFLLSLQWVPSVAYGAADSISRPSREFIIRLQQEQFRRLWEALGPFDMDLMASDASAQQNPFFGGGPPVLLAL